MKRSDNPKDINPQIRQLFTVLKTVSVPTAARYSDKLGSYLPPGEDIYPAMVFMAWPNGAPCIEIDMYLADLCKKLRVDSSGGSPRQEAVKLSHLVRFCWAEKKNFWDLTTLSYATFLQRLSEELKPSKTGKKREANQVRQISNSGIRFLTWLQKTLLPHRQIVGLANQPHQILLTEQKSYDGKRATRTFLVFSQNPPPSTPHAKVPMAQELITRLWEEAGKPSKEDESGLHARKDTDSGKLRTIKLAHLRQRRLLMLQLMLATGARPAEIAEMTLDANLISVKNKFLMLSTKKRESDAGRRIPTTMGVVVRLQAYAKIYRADICRALIENGDNPSSSNRLFLNDDGAPLTKESMTRDFARLCVRACINQRACLSMFRHKAITSLVALHIKDFHSDTSTTPLHAINLGDYTTILTKVAQITGHKRPESLKPYIHLAWEELGAFDSIDAAAGLVTMLQSFIPELRSYIDEFDYIPRKQQKRRLFDVLEWMRMMEKEISEGLEVFRHVKSHPEKLRALLP